MAYQEEATAASPAAREVPTEDEVDDAYPTSFVGEKHNAASAVDDGAAVVRGEKDGDDDDDSDRLSASHWRGKFEAECLRRTKLEKEVAALRSRVTELLLLSQQMESSLTRTARGKVSVPEKRPRAKRRREEDDREDDKSTASAAMAEEGNNGAEADAALIAAAWRRENDALVGAGADASDDDGIAQIMARNDSAPLSGCTVGGPRVPLHGTNHRTWIRRYDELRKFRERWGHCEVPQKYSENPDLGTWVMMQRMRLRGAYERGDPSELVRDRVARLNRLGFRWTAGGGMTGKDHDDLKWEGRLRELVRYRDAHGDTLVPAAYRAINPELYWWTVHQRKQRKLLLRGDKSQMTPERMARLESVGFVWDASHRRGRRRKIRGEQLSSPQDVYTGLEGKWERRFSELIAFREEFGHCKIPIRYDPNPELGRWVAAQRSFYHKRLDGEPSQITEERISRLNEVGFVWSVHTSDKRRIEDKIPQSLMWMRRFEELKEYKELHGTSVLPPSYKSVNPVLHRWVAYQRQQFSLLRRGKKSQLSPERIAKLEEIDFVWVEKRGHKCSRSEEDAHSDSGTGYCVEDGGDSAGTDSFPSSKHRHGNLHAQRWEERLAELIAYQAVHGNTRVPHDYKENLKLARWVCNQRSQYRALRKGMPSSMTEDRIEKLQKVGFEWKMQERKQTLSVDSTAELAEKRAEDEGAHKEQSTDEGAEDNEEAAIPRSAMWEHRLKELNAYKDKHGSTCVPTSYKSVNRGLFNWVALQRTQRRLMREGKRSQLTAERVAKLEQIGFVWVDKRGRRKSNSSIKEKKDDSKPPRSSKWELRYEELRQYQEEHGTTFLPPSFKSVNPALHHWVAYQRQQHSLLRRGMKSQLSPERIAKLEAIDFVWVDERRKPKGCERGNLKEKARADAGESNRGKDVIGKAVPTGGPSSE